MTAVADKPDTRQMERPARPRAATSNGGGGTGGRSGGGLADIFEWVVGPQAALGFRAFDGSESMPPAPAAVIELRSPEAINYMATAPSDLGIARAYVTGALEVRGDLVTALRHMLAATNRRVPWPDRVRIFSQLGPGVLRRPPIPLEEAPPPYLRGIRHSKRRDAAAIEHHYDASNRFYELLLGPSMTYTCALYPDAQASLEQAQWDKYQLVSRKLRLEPGMRLLDVGCGWGGMAMHAAREHGVSVVAVTLSAAQAEWGRQAVAQAGLDHLVDLRYSDYRDVPESEFDAISSIGLTEHVGSHHLGAYFRFLASKLRPGGRLLNHCITRPNGRQRARAGGFIDRYVFPDGELEGPGTIMSAMHDNGFELRHEENLREHYARTCLAWVRNLEAHWDEAVAEVGVRKARVWRLYLAMSSVGFEANRIQLHQALGVRLDGSGRSGFPLRPVY